MNVQYKDITQMPVYKNPNCACMLMHCNNFSHPKKLTDFLQTNLKIAEDGIVEFNQRIKFPVPVPHVLTIVEPPHTSIGRT